MRRFRSALVAASLLLVVGLPTGAVAGTIDATFTEYPVAAGAGLRDMTAGPDGALWFTERHGQAVGRITTSGTVTEFPVPTSMDNPLPDPSGIAEGPDGALWFTEQGGDAVDRVTTDGVFTRYTLPGYETRNGGSKGPSALTAGPDGALWFLETAPAAIGRVTTAGAITEFPLADGAPQDLVAGPDGALWMTDYGGNAIRRVATDGSVTSFDAPVANAGVRGITAGPDGALWFTESARGRIGRITTAGVATDFDAGSSEPSTIVLGPGGALWFDAPDGGGVDGLSRITPAGVTSHLLTPAGTLAASAGPDGNLWYLEPDVDRVLKVAVAPSPAPVECVVPKLRGKRLSAVGPLLTGRHCRLGHVTRARRDRHTPARRLVVVSQSRRVGARLPARTRVNVTVRRARH
jgi:virginiamycin B lyase